MQIAFLSSSLSSRAGGIFEIGRSLASNLASIGVNVSGFGLYDDQWENDRCLWSGTPCRVFPYKGSSAFGYAPTLLNAMVESDSDIAHLHTLWMYPSIAINRWHRRTGKPYIVTPNGMLEPWALQNSAWKKKLAALLYENPMLHAAACLQANTEKEATDFRAYGLKNPICVIPNGVTLPESRNEERRTKNEERRTLLFLGRLHPKKGLVNALRAWKEVTGKAEELKTGNAENWEFVIAGWDQGGHGEELKTLCRELGLPYSDSSPGGLSSASPASGLRPPTSVIFTGPVFGDAKDALLRRSDAFLLPSFSEGLPMAVLEAWAYGLPVLMSDHCNLPEGFRDGAALRIGTDVGSIATGMRDLLQGSCQDLETMGARGRTLVEERFTWPKVAAQMKEVYEWMVGGGEKPGCVL